MKEKTVQTATFTRLVSRGTKFVDRITRDAIEFALVDGDALELKVNQAFAKRVSVLRIHPPTAQIFDQDDWLIAAPHHQFARLEEKLRALAGHAQIPALTIISTVEDVTSYAHNAVTRSFSSATVYMPRGTGTLQVCWSRPAGTSIETLVVWNAAQSASEGATVLAASIRNTCPAAGRLVQDTASWISARAASAYVVVDASCVEGQILVNDMLPKLNSTSYAAVILVPTAASATSFACHRAAGTTAYSGAAAGYSTAFTLHKFFQAAPGRAPLAIVDASVWSTAHQTLMPVLREQLPLAAAGGPPLCFPCNVLPSARAFLLQVRHAYRDSRPYVHAFIGVGVLEADVREAVEGAASALAELGDQPAAAESLERLEPALLAKRGKLPAPPCRELSQPALAPLTFVPVGCAAAALGELLRRRPGIGWNVQAGSAAWKAGNSLVALDLSDATVETWLKSAVKAVEGCASEPGEGSPSCMHILALLPDCRASRTAWDNAAAPLAELMGGDNLELGMALAASLGGSGCTSGDLLGLLDALAGAHSVGASFHDIAFQLRPGPRAALCFPARLPTAGAQLGGDPVLLTLTGTQVKIGAVSASFSLWPSCDQSAADANADADAEGCLLSARFLRSSLAPGVMRAGVCYQSLLATHDDLRRNQMESNSVAASQVFQPTEQADVITSALQQVENSAAGLEGWASAHIDAFQDSPDTPTERCAWHLCADVAVEASLYRRAAGDFEGRVNGAFQWQGGEDGPKARLWELAAELDGDSGGQLATDNPEEDAADGSAGYSDDEFAEASEKEDT